MEVILCSHHSALLCLHVTRWALQSCECWRGGGNGPGSVGGWGEEGLPQRREQSAVKNLVAKPGEEVVTNQARFTPRLGDRAFALPRVCKGFSGGSVPKNPPAKAGDAADAGSIPGREDPLEQEMATHSSILAWRIPWTEEPGGLQSMGSSQKIRHDWARTQGKAEGSFLLSPRSIMWGHKKTAIDLLGTAGVLTKNNLPAPWIWTSQSPEMWEINVWCLSHPVYGNLLRQPELGPLGNITVTLMIKVD